jgi:hypothetical protein
MGRKTCPTIADFTRLFNIVNTKDFDPGRENVMLILGGRNIKS